MSRAAVARFVNGSVNVDWTIQPAIWTGAEARQSAQSHNKRTSADVFFTASINCRSRFPKPDYRLRNSCGCYMVPASYVLGFLALQVLLAMIYLGLTF